MGRGELVVVLGNTGHFIQIVHQTANGSGRDCIALNRMNKSTVTQMKLFNWIQGLCLIPLTLGSYNRRHPAALRAFGASAGVDWNPYENGSGSNAPGRF